MKKEIHIPKVGDKLFLVHLGRRDEASRTESATVSKVGRKYFTINIGYDIEFKLEDWRQNIDYVSELSLWNSKEEYDRHVQLVEKLDFIKKSLGFYSTLKPTDSQIDRIYTILQEVPNTP